MDLNRLRHSTAHLLAAAVTQLWPQALPTIGPAIENGFYYDFDFSPDKPKPADKITEADFPKIEAKMAEIIKSWNRFENKFVPASKAKQLFSQNRYKLELIDELENSGDKISVTSSGDFTDLCKGGHIDRPDKIRYFKLLSVAGAYWKGSEKNKMLTRIYGTVFETKKDLDLYLEQQKDALNRDHRKIGRDMDLYHIDDTVGLGLPLWHPKGALLWRIIEDFWYEKHLEQGYELVRSPHIGNRSLWETSGHLDFYNKSMYPPLEVGQSLEEKQSGKQADVSEEYLLKPMNCPFHIQIFNSRPRSYRELPIRWAECGTVYRYEKRGELSGLTRVRGFTQDDAHIICREEQVENELKRVVDFIIFIYKSFGFQLDSIFVSLSLRDPQNKDKYAGDDKGWNFTEKVLKQVALDKKLKFKEEPGEAAFYGPKLDFKIRDALGRLWQCSTLQFDFNLPKRFDMKFTNEKGNTESPYMLHRALFGSYERFIGLLIEHYRGAFPTWLSPVQVKILPITDKQNAYCENLCQILRNHKIRTEIDSRNDTLQAKIRNGQNEKAAYMLIIGPKEQASETITVRSRDGIVYPPQSLSTFIDKINQEINQKG